MLNFNQLNPVADNEVTINGTSFGKLTDEDTKKLIDIIKGMQSVGNTTTALQTTKPATQKTTKEDPDLGKMTYNTGAVTAYSKYIRYWEYKKTGFYLPKEKREKMCYAIKMSLKAAGAKWDDNKKAFAFPTVKSCNAWLKEQDEKVKKQK